MRFLVDAQLPPRLAVLFREAGHDVLHTLDLPAGNRTTDDEILRIAALEGRIVVTKDSDFVHSFHLRDRPEQLLLISTGNISNAHLEALLLSNLTALVQAFHSGSFVELVRTGIVIDR